MQLIEFRNEILNGKSINDIPLRVAIYARVSTEKDEQLNSLNNQIEYFENYVNQNENWTYVGSYIDEGMSGTSVKKRDNFLKMIDDSKQGRFDLILTKEISRFSRNTIDSIKYTQELLFNNVAVFFMNDGINTLMPDSELRLTIMSSLAQDEVRRLSERVRFGLKRSIEKGVVLGSSNIYGYKKDKGKLILDHNQKAMIQFIYENYANSNLSLLSLSKLLYVNNYKNKFGKMIDPTIIRRIIENPKYKGYYCGNKSRILDYRNKKKMVLSKEEWHVYKDEQIPVIVTEEIWDKANIKLKQRQETFMNKSKERAGYQSKYRYSGKIYCSIDNEIYHRSGSGKRRNNPVWECKKYRIYGSKGCNNDRIFNKKLNEIFDELIIKILKNNNIITDLMARYEKLDINISSNNQDKISKLLDLYLEGLLGKKEYKERLSNLQKGNSIVKVNTSVIEESLKINDKILDVVFSYLINKIIVEKERRELIIYLKNNEILTSKY